MVECDLAVIGGGPGGYVAAIRAAQLGASVVVVERAELGGVCLNCGCIPTKTLLHAAGLYRKLRNAKEYGLEVKELGLNMPALLHRKNEVIRRNRSGIQSLFKAHGIRVVKAEGCILAPGQVQAGKEELRARAILIATGSSPAGIPALAMDGHRVISSTEALELDYVPSRVAVVGAGPVGAEFACLWNAFGAQVSLIEMLPRLLPREDEELTKLLEASFRKRGIDVRTETTVAKADINAATVSLELEGAKAGTIEADVVLVSAGCKFNSEVATNNPALGIGVGSRGEIQVDEHMETRVPGIFAIGDVVGKTMLAHGASAEGLVAAENAVKGGRKVMDYRVVPACTFTSPEVASVGLTEAQARAAGLDLKIGRFPFLASGRAHTLGQPEGIVKIIGDRATDEVIGVHILGPEAGELIAAGALAMALEATAEEIAHTIHTHPTLSEAFMEAAEDYMGMGIHTPPRKR
jgi:dihydrolipoamide dehydrogenase